MDRGREERREEKKRKEKRREGEICQMNSADWSTDRNAKTLRIVPIPHFVLIMQFASRVESGHRQYIDIPD